jgi:TatD DNase family protein
MCSIPSDRLMIETDAPWCDLRPTHASWPHIRSTWNSVKKEKCVPVLANTVKGRNEPCNIIQVLEVIAGARGEDPIKLASIIYNNTRRVFFPSSTA